MRMLLQNNIAAAILAGAAVIVCVWQIVVGDDIVVRAHYAFGVVPAVLGKHANVPPELSFMFAPLRLLTSLLLHENFLVLSVNVGALLLFGRTAEIGCNPLRAGGIFLCGGIFAGLVICIFAPVSTHAFVGLQGAVSAMFGCRLVLQSDSTTGLLPGTALRFLRSGRSVTALGFLAWMVVAVSATTPDAQLYSALLPAYTTSAVVGAILGLILKERAWRPGL